MKLSQWTAVLAVAAIALAPAANAAANFSDCMKLAKQVAAALQTAQPGDATDAAKDQEAAARAYCTSSMYAEGVAHYTKALQLLGKG
ncbi:MAG TPA: hypothetical protein VMU01_02695 [Rhizomicrobium sp.]|nr:hypothetical protein [Rhizomicrobium sp.]